MSNAPALVSKGITKLNEFFDGPSWTRRVSVYALSMASCDKCILGQLFGDYETGVIAMKNLDGGSYGFASSSLATSEELTKEWGQRVDRMRNPLAGDKVHVTYSVDWKSAYFHQDITLSPYAMKAAIVSNPRPDPEPGDRVKHTSSLLNGTVLKTKPGGVVNGHVQVLWDGSTTRHSTPSSSLTVLTA